MGDIAVVLNSPINLSGGRAGLCFNYCTLPSCTAFYENSARVKQHAANKLLNLQR